MGCLQKKIKFSLSILIIVVMLSCKSSYIDLRSDNNYLPIEQVSVKDYKSVQLRDSVKQNPNLALGVSFAGGGSRAQYYGIGILIGLEEIKISTNSKRSFLSEIDYFSTVSGGGYGVSYYLTIQKNLLSKSNQTFRDFYFSKNGKYEDFIYKSANKLTLLRRSSYQKQKRKSMTERLDFAVLQYDKINSNNSNKFSTQMTLNDFFVNKDSKSKIPELPMFVANGTIYNNGERFPFMPHIISNLEINSYLEPNKGEISLNDNLINNGYDFPLTYAITSSSAFPGALPDVRYGIKGKKDEILVVIDGGTTDNLGYSTLFELLSSDTTPEKNRNALIVDCSGEGQLERYNKNEKIGFGNLLTTSVFFTVQTKYVHQDAMIEKQRLFHGISDTNLKKIGFFTIKDYLNEYIQTDNNDDNYKRLKYELSTTKNKHKYWFEFYKQFRDSLYSRFPESFDKDDQGELILSSLSSEKFKEFTPYDMLFIFEYASHVETKLKIYASEAQILILAGRYTVFLKQNQLKDLLIIE